MVTRRCLDTTLTAACFLVLSGAPATATEVEEPVAAPPINIQSPPDISAETADKPVHEPPQLPPRQPLPPPPAVAELPPAGNGTARPSLAWRAVAHKLWQFPDGRAPRSSKGEIVLKCDFRSALKALVFALNKLGYTVAASSPASGHVLAIKNNETQPDRSIRLVFALRESVQGETTIRAGTDPERMKIDQRLLADLVREVDGKLNSGDRL